MNSLGFPYPEAILFDWDNTLVDSWPVITEALNATRSAFGLPVWSVAEARIKSNRAMRESFPEWFGAAWEKARDLFYDRFAAVHCERLSVMDDAESLLRFLHGERIPLFVVSNKKNTYLQAEIDFLGWTSYFRCAMGSGDAPVDKPAREPVDKALASAGLKADNPRIWFVGDTYGDVECALRSGCMPVLLHDQRSAQQFGIKLFFSDCHTMATAIKYWGRL